MLAPGGQVHEQAVRHEFGSGSVVAASTDQLQNAVRLVEKVIEWRPQARLVLMIREGHDHDLSFGGRFLPGECDEAILSPIAVIRIPKISRAALAPVHAV